MTPAATPSRERVEELRDIIIQVRQMGVITERHQADFLALLDQYALQTNQNNDHVGQKNGQDKEDK